MIYPGQYSAQSTMLMIEEGFRNISINVIDKGSEVIKDVSTIRPYPPGFMLNNWTAEDLLVVYKSSE